MKTKFISIEGVDSVGKETQTKLLKSALMDLASVDDVPTFTFPDYKTASGQLVRDYLTGKFGPALEMDPYLASALYVLDRTKYKDRFDNLIALEDNIVLLDRYVHSNPAFQGGKINDREKRIDFYRHCETFEFLEHKLPMPDIIFFLDASPKVAQELMGTRGGQEKDQHESNIPFLENAYQNYKELMEVSALKEQWVVINCIEDGKLRSIESIHQEILKITKERLNIS